MPNYVPCLTSDNQVVHLSAAQDPGNSLCGKSTARRTVTIGDTELCVVCAKRLLAAIFQEAGPDGVASVEVIVNRRSAPPPPLL